MKQYLVRISWDKPYPIYHEYRVQGSSIPVAVGKALRLWRKVVKGQRISHVMVDAKCLGTIIQTI